MNSHQNARTTYEGRELLIERIAVLGVMPAAEAAGIGARAAAKWRDRFLAEGEAGLFDRSSRPYHTRTSLDAALVERIERLRRDRRPMRIIARTVGRSVAPISRLPGRLGLSTLKALDPRSTAVRYEHVHPGALLHIDIKKLGRIVRPSHRVTSDQRDSVERLLTDNGSAYRSRHFAKVCQALGIKHSFTRPYRPQTNGNAERFIQTCLRE